MYARIFENVLLLGPARKLCLQTSGPETMRNTCSMKQVCHSIDMERHRRNVTEELRDHRQQGDRERRMVARQQEMYVRRSQHLGGESQRRARETEEHR